MTEAKCPACRRRFPVDAESAECARCGADLSLLIQLRGHAARAAAYALAAPNLSLDERTRRLKTARFTCGSSEIQRLIESLATQ